MKKIPILRFKLFTLFIGLSSLFLNNTYLFKNNNKKNIYIEKILNKHDGYDMRYIDKNNLNHSENSSIIFNYREIFNKYKIYKLLKNENISINIKLELIKKENILDNNIVSIVNITKGGLYKDWDFFF